MSRRHYTNNAPVTTLSASLTNIATTCTVTTATGMPSAVPWTAVIDAGTATAEVVLVTAVSGTTLTITRGYDGTAAQAHANGAAFAHVAVQADFDDANNHVNSSSGVHGLVGAVVGTSDAQTLTNKTLTAPAITGPNVTGTVSGGPTITAPTLTGPTISGTVAGGATYTSPVLSTPTINNPTTTNPTVSGGTVSNSTNTGDATHPALVGKATSAGGKTLSLQNSSAVEKASVDDAGNISAATVTTTGAVTAGGAVTVSAGGASVTGGLTTDTFRATGNARVDGSLYDSTGTNPYLNKFTNGLGPMIGTFDPTKPIKRDYRYVESTTDASGNKGIAPNATATAILDCRITPVFRTSPQAQGLVWQIRLDTSSLSSVTVQFRDSVTGSALTTTSVAYVYELTYQ